jgi:hypothetical protein
MAAGPLAPVGVDIAAERPRGMQHRDLSRVTRGLVPSSRRALLKAVAVLISALNGACAGSGGGLPAAASLISPAQVQTTTGCIRFSVSVPVLSAQITSVEPSVSTELKRFTTARRRAKQRHRHRERQG